MKFPLLIFLFLTTSFYCSEKSNRNSDPKAFEIIDFPAITLDEVKQDYTISWTDSGSVKLKKANQILAYPRINYDSAIIVYYNGHTSYFPLNNKGKWISTIHKSTSAAPTDLRIVDSLLGDRNSFDSTSSAGELDPKYGIAYFKSGNLIGQTIIGPGSQTVKSFFQLPKSIDSKRLNNSAFLKIRSSLDKKLRLYEDLPTAN